MFWSDNGKTGKVVPDLRLMYKYTIEGKELKDQFVEFYFSTGLYNYYIEAYPEAHPTYKPLLAFMQKGDKALGLEQLNHAINEAVFLKVEALLFMSLIQLKYEKDLNTAAIYARRLHHEYPRNTYYQGQLLTILLHQQRYKEANELLESMEPQKDPWTEMNRVLAKAYMDEANKQANTEEKYRLLLESGREFWAHSRHLYCYGLHGSFQNSQSKTVWKVKPENMHEKPPSILPMALSLTDSRTFPGNQPHPEQG